MEPTHVFPKLLKEKLGFRHKGLCSVPPFSTTETAFHTMLFDYKPRPKQALYIHPSAVIQNVDLILKWWRARVLPNTKAIWYLIIPILILKVIKTVHKGSFIIYVRVPREGGWKNFYILLLCGGRVKSILMQYFPTRYFILEISRSSGLAEIIFHLRLKGKKSIRRICFLLVFLVLICVKLRVLM